MMGLMLAVCLGIQLDILWKSSVFTPVLRAVNHHFYMGTDVLTLVYAVKHCHSLVPAFLGTQEI